MAEVHIDARYQVFALQLVSLYQERGATLSEEAQALVLLATEAWFRDAPKFKAVRTEEEMKLLAHLIVETSLEETHVKRSRERYTRQPVPFHLLLFALARSGHKLLRDLLEKGF